MKHSSFVLAMAAYMLAVTPFAHATVINYAANLNGANESPSNASPGTGFALVTVDDVAHTMHVQATFSGLLSGTTVAHIHCCTAVPLTGVVAPATTTPSFTGFPQGVTSGTYDIIMNMTLASSYNPAFVAAHGGIPGAEADLFAGMSLGRSYFNIHTTQFPGGEIRGFLTQVPEPATLALFCFGLAGLCRSRYRRAHVQQGINHDC